MSLLSVYTVCKTLGFNTLALSSFKHPFWTYLEGIIQFVLKTMEVLYLIYPYTIAWGFVLTRSHTSRLKFQQELIILTETCGLNFSMDSLHQFIESSSLIFLTETQTLLSSDTPYLHFANCNFYSSFFPKALFYVSTASQTLSWHSWLRIWTSMI